jgi:peptide/nickel transport system permease protein
MSVAERLSVEEARTPRRIRSIWLEVLVRHPPAAVGALVLIAFALAALLAPVIAPYGLYEQVGPVYGVPTISHPLGLDDAGYDVVTVLIWGARASLFVGFAASVVSVLLGGSIGIVAGYVGGWVDGLLMRVTDYFLVVPTIPLLIVVAAVWGASIEHTTLIIALLLWTTTARVIRAQVKSLRERAYVQRAHSIGAGHLRVVFRHIVPQIAPLLIASTVLTVSVAIFLEAALDFLGLGDPATVSWGIMIENAFERTAITAGAWWAIVPPGVCIAVVILACSLIGQAAEHSLNPRLRVSHLAPRSFRIRPGP